MEIRKCILTKNDCYKAAKPITPKGIVVHSTGANNPYLKRYIQPDDGVLGKNENNNHWNRSGVEKCVHAFIGKDINGVVRCYQTLPLDIACWGVGKGSKGSYNYSPAYLQFEICEDNLTNQDYFTKVFKTAIELCAFWCQEYNLSVDNIVSHNEANKRGYGSNHADCDHWLKKFGKDMNWFRAEVKAALNKDVYTVKKGDSLWKIAQEQLGDGSRYKEIKTLNNLKSDTIRVGQVLKMPSKSTQQTISKGSTVKLKSGAKTYTGKKLASFVYNRTHKVKEINGDRVVITYLGITVAAVNIKDLTLV